MPVSSPEVEALMGTAAPRWADGYVKHWDNYGKWGVGRATNHLKDTATVKHLVAGKTFTGAQVKSAVAYTKAVNIWNWTVGKIVAKGIVPRGPHPFPSPVGFSKVGVAPAFSRGSMGRALLDWCRSYGLHPSLTTFGEIAAIVGEALVTVLLAVFTAGVAAAIEAGAALVVADVVQGGSSLDVTGKHQATQALTQTNQAVQQQAAQQAAQQDAQQRQAAQQYQRQAADRQRQTKGYGIAALVLGAGVADLLLLE